MVVVTTAVAPVPLALTKVVASPAAPATGMATCPVETMTELETPT